MYNNYYSVNTYDNGYLAHRTEYPLTLTKKKDKEYNDYISSVIRDLVKEARSEKIRSERECVDIIKRRAVDEVLSWPKINTPYDREGTLLRVLLKRYNSTNKDKVAEAMGKEVFNILRFTKTSKPYTGPAVTIKHSTDDDYLAHHGILGMKWGVRRYQNEDGTLTEAGKKRYRSYDQTLETTAGLKNMARYGTPIAAGLGGVSTLLSAAPYVAMGMISTPMLLGAVAGGVAGGALSSQIARGELFLMEKFYGMRQKHFNNKMKRDRNKTS